MDLSLYITGVDLLGTFAFGLSGGTVAIRHRLDIFGVIVLAVAAALAGGMLRDMLLGATPVVALADERYTLVALAAALVAFFFKPLISGLGKPVMVFDALGLGLFAVTGCRKGLEYGLDPVVSVLLGVLTAVGGGLVRDLLVTEIPRVLREEIYALAAFVGATVVVVGEYLDLADWLVTLVGVSAAFSVRVISVIYGWSAPRSPWP
ncbi:hypothetical protein C5F48_15740 [Cereibacter changlensis JA139]|uniref:Glycine transporter domain-containing protein n=2 Tax=Cereibacter changlensis TaxID=402884 RepID=A0A2T4JS89_9RHOB|nr:trimeric intracellular cation channel family protein [Cereibacter changlensis]PTE20759.1 hypothetical protein C5F48_15740 [Cereibacter changlensis JA139]PZX49529.1 putative membrane protein YeiH [Cereibacter changlensis]